MAASTSRGGANSSSAKRHARVLGSIVALAAGTVLLCGTAPAQPRTCATDLRELAGLTGMPRVRELVCPTSGGSSLRVTFLRLDEVLAGNLVLGTKTPELDRLLGNARFVENDVSREFKIIFQRFAHEDVVAAGDVKLTVTLFAPRAGGSADRQSADVPAAASQDDRHLWSISQRMASLDTPAQHSISMPAAINMLYKGRGWPKGFKQAYNCSDDVRVTLNSGEVATNEVGPISCTTNWRYVPNLKDLDVIERDTDSMIRDSNPGAEDSRDWSGDRFVHKKHFALLRYLGQKSWPADFLVIAAELEVGCEVSDTGYYVMPPFGLDVAIIENSSDRPIRVRDLIGVMERDRGLRQASARDVLRSQAAPLNAGASSLAPGERIIIPLRAFAIGGVVDADRWGSIEKAQNIYRQIQAARAASFDMTVRASRQGEAISQVRKDKSAFGPPEMPRRTEYLVGSRLFLSGLLVEDQTVDVGAGAPNIVAMFPAEATPGNDAPQPADVKLHIHETIYMAGSCPILYAWNERQGEWVDRGKVIHAANGRENETTSTVDIGTDVRRIRLSEEELEMSHIRAVALVLTLRDGRRVRIEPAGAPFARAAPWLKIPAYRDIDFRFDVPAEYELAGIARSEVEVTGYYDRYSTLWLTKLLRPRARAH